MLWSYSVCTCVLDLVLPQYIISLHFIPWKPLITINYFLQHSSHFTEPIRWFSCQTVHNWSVYWGVLANLYYNIKDKWYFSSCENPLCSIVSCIKRVFLYLSLKRHLNIYYKQMHCYFIVLIYTVKICSTL